MFDEILPQDIDHYCYGHWTQKTQAYFIRQQVQPSAWWWGSASSATLYVVGMAMRGLISCGFRTVQVDNLDRLINIIEDPIRDRPVISCHPATIRFYVAFFSLGQTIPTVRGGGIYQAAVNVALVRLKENEWVHVFPEARCNQKRDMLRFKWGVGRLIMESPREPIIIPIYHQGMEDVLPLDQPFPIPHFNPFRRKLVIRVGKPIDMSDVILAWKQKRCQTISKDELDALDCETRITITNILWKALNDLKHETEKLYPPKAISA
ncbi:Lyso-phosphatidylcholine acyltransferase [Spiromyces aspiralis]|uniref:Lyso-phosphatidylcholine acyltransferase n=1 Tax=Spiromyces aspiralis TaxID=68401 RepID=A0ACC1HFK7_9FUNG|nr:Lyso-phosphatidylcholine acyltransferase [Spiromyces aspiralis]